MTPIFIDEASFPARCRFPVRIHPTHGLRSARLSRPSPLRPSPALRQLAILAVFAAAAFMAAGLFFRHLKRGFTAGSALIPMRLTSGN